MAYLIHYCRAPGRLTATMSLGTARETVELVRCLAGGGFTVSTIRCTSRGGYSITIEQLEARIRPEQRPAAADRPEVGMPAEGQPAAIEPLVAQVPPERLPAIVEQLEAHALPERPPSAVSDTIMGLIKRHSIAGSYV